MATKYPIILVHGIAAKQLRILNAFGKIGFELENEGHLVYVADTDGFGSIETNAAQLKRFIDRVTEETGCEKVNIIAHSKGGLDSQSMIQNLGLEDRVASLTTLCTPHRGSIIASKIWMLPSPIKKFYAFWIDTFYRLFCNDEHPNSMKACDQLRAVDEAQDTISFCDSVYCQSYSTSISKIKDCYIMALPMKLQHRYDLSDNDGMVAEGSSKFGRYRGKCLEIPVSHVQIIDLFSKRSQRPEIYSFYKHLCSELEEMGY